MRRFSARLAVLRKRAAPEPTSGEKQSSKESGMSSASSPQPPTTTAEKGGSRKRHGRPRGAKNKKKLAICANGEKYGARHYVYHCGRPGSSEGMGRAAQKGDTSMVQGDEQPNHIDRAWTVRLKSFCRLSSLVLEQTIASREALPCGGQDYSRAQGARSR